VSRHGRVVVAMSGGVDSAVAAALLHEEGWEVLGLTMKLHDHAATGVADAALPQRGCCDLTAYRDARRVCGRLGVPHAVVDLADEFRREVMDVFADEYFAGRTPNPCVLCNTRLKWEHLWRRAEALDADAVATGHYARLEPAPEGGTALLRALRLEKDQSYALWGLPRARLARTRFPLGGLAKEETRRLAAELELAVADKPESQDICFVPDGDYPRFLRHHDPERAARETSGELVAPDGRVLGRHGGVSRFTVGQRRGLGVALPGGRPVYVKSLDPLSGRVQLGWDDELFQDRLWADGLNWLTEQSGQLLECRAAIRYRDPGTPAQVVAEAEGVVRVDFAEPRRAIAPGQAVVFYHGERVLGGGWIRRAGQREESGHVG
jgi:tRNA-specific 2-thiouridylase